MSTASQLRRSQDQQLLNNLITRSAGELQPKGKLDTQSDRVTFELNLPTVASTNYPSITLPFRTTNRKNAFAPVAP
jgi:hypothetical protein